MASYVRSAVSVFFEYDTPRIVHIRSKKVGIINRFLQLAIIGYIIGYVIVYKKGYQEFENVQSAVTSKLKGIVFTNYSGTPSLGNRTWDVADYVIPPQENNAFFVMTNVLVTNEQSQGACDEDPGVKNITCISDDHCENLKGKILPGSSGPITGKCVNSTWPGHEHQMVCQIRGWCPVENENLAEPNPVLGGSKDFTVFIKNNVEFPRFGVKVKMFNMNRIPTGRNLVDKFKTDEELASCRWNRHDSLNKYCPIFELSAIAKDAGVKFEDMTDKGGVMQIVIDWTCNLDYSVDDCVPDYTFRRLDKGDFKISRGFNFRYANQYVMNDKHYRNLFKAYGIRFVINVQGKAGKFNIVPLFLNIGSGLALLSVATIICDIVVLYVLKAKSFYRDKKYLDVKGQDAFQILDESTSKSEGGFEDGVHKRTASGSHQDS